MKRRIRMSRFLRIGTSTKKNYAPTAPATQPPHRQTTSTTGIAELMEMATMPPAMATAIVGVATFKLRGVATTP